MACAFVDLNGTLEDVVEVGIELWLPFCRSTRLVAQGLLGFVVAVVVSVGWRKMIEGGIGDG